MKQETKGVDTEFIVAAAPIHITLCHLEMTFQGRVCADKEFFFDRDLKSKIQI